MKIPREYSHPVKIGAGAFSTVLRVREKRLDRPLALKVFALRGRAASGTVEKEARLLASIGLSCVPRIYGVHRRCSSVMLAMEWIDGVPLSAFIVSSPSAAVRRAVALDIVKALSLLHGCDIVHRDIKPDNIMLTPDRGVVFIDLGFSGTVAAHGDPAALVSLKGTPRYMAPELWVHTETVDFRKADLYSMGVVLRELCGPDVPPCIEELLRSDPALRPPDGIEFARVWEAQSGPADTAAARLAVAQATAGYASKLLFEGARELYAAGRREEAYALVAESLERWPDNPDAAEMLQNRFSGPFSRVKYRPAALWAGGGLLFLLALSGAFLFGKLSGDSDVDGSGGVPGVEAENRRLSVGGSAAGGAGGHAAVKIDLLEYGSTPAPEGTISVLLPSGKGTLWLDSKPVVVNASGCIDVRVPAGTHRIEWLDSTSGRTFGETVDVLPFAMRTVSFERKPDGRR